MLRRLASLKQPENKMAGATGLEPATSGVTGQRSNQLSYAPPPQIARAASYAKPLASSTGLNKKVIRATDAKEVGVENPSEETFCRPNQRKSVLAQTDKVEPECQLTIQ